MSRHAILRRRRGQNLLTLVRNNYTDALLPGLWTRDGVRLNGAGTVAGVDDARCTSSTGRLMVPLNAGSCVDLGNQDAALGGATKLTVIARFAPQSLTVAGNICGRNSAVGDATSPFSFRRNGAAIAFAYWSGSAFVTANGPALTLGTDTVAAVVFDGTNGVVADRIKLAAAASTAPGVFPATALTSVGATTAPAALGSTTTTLTIGAAGVAGSILPLGAPLDVVAIYIGQALTAAQIDAEIANGYAGAHHRYTFDGTLTDSGSTGGWNGTAVGSGLAYCSDDVRWGPILMGGGGTANPTWDATNREAVFDGVSQYLRANGGTLASLSVNAAVLMVGSPATSGSRDVDLSAGNSSTLVRARFAGPTIIEGNGTSVSLAAPPDSTRLLVTRRTGAVIGGQFGQTAELTSTGVAGGETANRLTLGADRSDPATVFGNPKWRGLLAYNGDFAGKQSLAYAWAQSLGAAL